ncbi:endonuclease/exonuclease/phosphatase family protein [Stieleria sp. JC731]|uniref:endonuclease/exonuclease/phosphatase family protein n=1 Tax=Pirellulaceae TaxID=2691357 RepID=UPI001E465420|nr:endonuclease/exonuclease/phosphatase family protein [Stieleria sp. JC731]MCC9601218.1 endonuclease/exonuclease/phosphatase family protein [Stieleria sp. JC731]
MKSLFWTAALVCMATFTLSAKASEPLRVMSFNLRYGAANDGDNHWNKRKSFVTTVVSEFAPDLMGTQETLAFQKEFILGEVSGYEYFGRSRMNTPNEHCGIFFKADRFVQLAGGHFWLSESPETPESKSWDSSLPRMATWVLLQDKETSEQPILFVNTHFDHRGRQSRLEAGRLLSERIDRLSKIANDPLVIVTGDFNCDAGSEPYQALVDGQTLKDTYRDVHPTKQSGEGTFNSWQGKTDGARIDWIATSKNAVVKDAEIVHTSFEDHFPSDHYPITAIIAK